MDELLINDSNSFILRYEQTEKEKDRKLTRGQGRTSLNEIPQNIHNNSDDNEMDRKLNVGCCVELILALVGTSVLAQNQMIHLFY